MYFEKVRAIFAEYLGFEEDEITMESLILEDLNADSLDVVDIAMAIEDEFEIEVPDEALENIRRVGDVVKFLEENA